MGQSKKTGLPDTEQSCNVQYTSNHKSNAEELAERATLLLKQYRFHEAEDYIVEAISIFRSQALEVYSFADCLLIYSEIMLGLNKPDEAKAISLEAYSLLINHAGDQNIETIHALTYVAICNLRLNQFIEAEAQLRTAMNFYLESMGELSLNNIGMLEYLMILYSNQKDYERSDELFIKLISLLEKYYRSELKELNESERLAVLDSLWARELMIYNYLIENFSRNPQLISEALKFRLYSKDLMLKKFNKENTSSKTFFDLQKTIPEGSTAIEIIKTFHFDHYMDRNRLYYIIMAVTSETKDRPLIIIRSLSQKDETEWLEKYNAAFERRSIDIYSYDNFWKDIEELVPDKKNIYISPEGVYRLIDFNALINPEGQFLIEEKEIVTVNDFNYFDFNNKITLSDKSACLVGNPFFGLVDSPVFPKLSNTEKEVLNIGELLRDNGWEAEILVGKEASRTNLLKHLSSEVIHVATHGFYRSLSNDTTDINEIMEYSGILLSDSLIVEAVSAETQIIKESVLTARDIYSLDLSNVKLVVLSMCESAKGRIMNWGGLLGLPRSIIYSGAKCLIVSPHRVSDEFALELMTIFYKKLLENKDVHSAFREAQLAIKAIHRHPYFWGGFYVLTA